MTRVYGALAYICASTAIALLGLGLLVGASQQAWGAAVGEIPQPTNKCDGNACTDCSWNPQVLACRGLCNTVTNAQICKDCECWIYTPNATQSQCYCTKGRPIAPPATE